MSAIDDKARALGGWIGSKLGEQTTAAGVSYAVYSAGVMIVSSPQGTFEVHGAIYQRYRQLGSAQGAFGVPLSDESGTPDGVGRYNHFEHGSIYWSPTTGAHEVHGAIRDTWANEGWERGALGYPISDELQGPTYRYQFFQFGALRWTAQEGVVHGCPPDALFGVADLHCHPMAHLGFGGKLWGDPSGPIEQALSHCEPAHGVAGSGFSAAQVAGMVGSFLAFGPAPGGAAAAGFAALDPWSVAGVIGLEGPHFTGGFPEFDGWPTVFSRLHQQMHVDWIERAYRAGGLRLMVALTVHSELIASLAPRRGFPLDDMAVVEAQIRALRQLVSAHKWMEIVRTPAEARKAIAAEKLAIVVGVEMDSLGNWGSENDCEDADVVRLVDHLYKDLDVRVVFPVHLADSAFGGASCYETFFAFNSRILRGKWQSFKSSRSVRFRLFEGLPDDLNLDGVDDVHMPGRFSATSIKTVLLEAIRLKRALARDTSASAGHVNIKGLTPRGKTLLSRMMRHGMLIDIDHMCESTAADTLAFVGARHYPVMGGHASFREIALDTVAPGEPSEHLRHESAKTAAQLTAMHDLGGVVGAITAVGDVKDHPTSAGIVGADCPGSTATWARSYLYAVSKMAGRVGLGTDFNGLVGSCVPRFGPQVARPIAGDGPLPQRRQVARDTQQAGVRYSGPLQDYRRNRFELGKEAYDEEHRDIWEAISFALSGAPIESYDHPFRAIWQINDRILDIARGIRAASVDELLQPGPFAGVHDPAVYQRGAFYAAHPGAWPSPIADANTRAMYALIRPVYERFEAMEGPNRPIDRARAGRHDWDYNIDGFCHIGLLPDFLCDLGNVGVNWDTHMMPLLRSPESFVQTWERCTTPAMRKKVEPLRVDPPTVPRIPIKPWNPAQFPVDAILHAPAVIHLPPH